MLRPKTIRETVKDWESKDSEIPNGRHQRNGHTLILAETTWKCLQCHHYFDAAIDAEKFFCGDKCKH